MTSPSQGKWKDGIITSGIAAVKVSPDNLQNLSLQRAMKNIGNEKCVGKTEKTFFFFKKFKTYH